MPKTAVLVARDRAGCLGLRPLEQELKDRGFQICSFLSFGDPMDHLTADIANAISKGSCVVVGRSYAANRAVQENWALQCGLERGLPLFMYSDGWVSLLPWFAERYERLACLFVLHEHCRQQVKQIFPSVPTLVSGNPEWEEFHRGPSYEVDRQLIREKLANLGIHNREKLILCTGVKNPEINIALWTDVAQATSKMKEKFSLLASMHPQDSNTNQYYMNRLSGKMSVPLRLIRKSDDQIETAQLIPASHIVIGSLSTTDDRACCQGKRVIEYLSPMALNTLADVNALLPESEGRIWPPCHIAGASRLALNPKELEEAVREIYSEQGFAQYRAAQKRLYGEKGPTPGTAIRIMADEIVWQLAGRKWRTVTD